MNQESNRGQFSFSKDERITNKKIIQNLFESGKKIIFSPFILKYLDERKESKNKVLISVSKSKIKSSVKRNLLKRRIRESYRLNKNIIKGLGYSFAFVYSSSKILSYNEINKSLVELLNKVNQDV
ncbi:MAG: ribonuclease P protein component [Rhodobacteraceae bacterium]|nr:ribonuclease P protein component [Paracoccaceae bacterium]|tara:strand:- start:1400 stop:1774 length:375 start_codon:yes stop_codon:yes gene_type:complete